MSVLVKLTDESRSAFSPAAGSARSENSFSDNLMRLLDRVDCRRADSGEERQAIFRLRYEAYLREGAIDPHASESFSDSYDDVANAYLFGIYLDGELASSIRLHIVSKDHPSSSSVVAFRDILLPEIDAGKTIVDSSRFVADEKLSRLHRGLPYITTRLGWLAARYFRAEHALAPVRPEHQAFYGRVFGHRTICGPRAYPGLKFPPCLMTIHPPTVEEDVHRRYPVMRSSFTERRCLFERDPSQSRPIKKQAQATLEADGA
jgi:Autoinducer synthase